MGKVWQIFCECQRIFWKNFSVFNGLGIEPRQTSFTAPALFFGIEPKPPALFVTEIPTQTPLKT
jgi:hypothetical protein